MSRNPTEDEIKQVARNAIRVFSAQGLRTCLFGGAACRLYGTSRTPNDVDIVVLTSNYSTEDLKKILSQGDSSFYLVPSKQTGQTYKVLWARLRGNYSYSRRSCKVDVLIPGILNIPSVPHHLVKHISNIPVMPLIPLLLLKLQGWDDHRSAARADLQQKQYVDIRDVSQLLQIAVTRGETLQGELEWLPTKFVDAGRARLAKYLQTLRPTNAGSWKQIGFEVEEEFL